MLEKEIGDKVIKKIDENLKSNIHRVRVKVEGDKVILTGSVDSQEAFDSIEEAVESIPEVREVENNLDIE